MIHSEMQNVTPQGCENHGVANVIMPSPLPISNSQTASLMAICWPVGECALMLLYMVSSSSTQVKDQGKCKSSWAFSAIGALEGQNFKESGHLLDLSVQQAIDCSWLHGNRGCHGGLATSVFDYVNREHGICASSSYSYVGYVSA